MNSIFFSIVIPLYNKEKYIKRTLQSVVNQTFSNFEMIIIDDGSTDKSCDIVESINDPRICLIRQENGGPSKARNRGIKEAKGEFIAFLDADDEWLPEKLEKQHEFHSKNPNVGWSCCGYRIIGGEKEKTVVYKGNGILIDTIDVIVDGLSIWTSAVVIKKDIFDNDSFLFNELLSRSEDRELWYKMACMYPQIGYINTVLAQYNVGINDSLTANENIDLSFLNMESRIENELSIINSERKNKLLNYIKLFNIYAILNIWTRTKTFSQYSDDFSATIDKNFLDYLDYWNFLPKTIKKIFRRYWIYSNPYQSDIKGNNRKPLENFKSRFK